MGHVAAFAAGLLAFAVLGCGGSGDPKPIAVKGKVVFDGKAVKNATVRYAPLDPQHGRIASAETDDQGEFEMSTFQPGDGVLPGKYRISVTAYVIPDDATPEQIEKGYFSEPAIPEKYFNVEKSGLEDAVDDSHSGFIELNLKAD